MTESLQQAISLMKAGKNQEAQQLLAGLLKNDPNNDQVWLCMSVVVPVERRKYCIEKALSINPNNLQARQALNSLPQPAPAVTPPAPRIAGDPPVRPAQPPVATASGFVPISSPEVRPVAPRIAGDLPVNPAKSPAAPAPTPVVSGQGKPYVWTKQRKSLFYMTILTGTELITGMLNPGLVKQANAQLQQGKLPLDLLKAIKHIPLNRITEVKQHLSILTVRYTKENEPVSTDLSCKDEPMAEDMLRALETRLGAAFERSAVPTTKGAILGTSCFGSAILLAIISFFYFAAQDLVKNNVRPMGSARVRGRTILLELLGPNGVMCIGVIILLVVVFVTVSTLAKPPLITKLLPKGVANQNV